MNTIPKMKGYKATDKNMCCRGKQFTLGEWYEHEGELIECASGFHFCEQPSGVWTYYTEATTRVFEIEAEEVLDTDFQPGTAYKRVARRIKFVREVEIGGDSNTGDSNTGRGNTGNRNTGNRNTGDSNTGWGNSTDCSTGFFNQKEATVRVFDQETRLTYAQFVAEYPEYYELSTLLHKPGTIDPAPFKRIPGFSVRKLRSLHRKHLAAKMKP